MRKTTKDQLSDALKSLLETQALSEITVSDISDKCNMSRMTFYYHFRGVKDAVSYMLMKLFNERCFAKDKNLVWMNSIANLFECMSSNKQLFLNIYKSIGHDQIQDIISCALSPVADEQIEKSTKRLHLTEDDKEFVKSFFGNAVVGVCFDWIETGMEDSDIEIMVERCGMALQNSVMSVLKAFDKKNKALEKELEENPAS